MGQTLSLLVYGSSLGKTSERFVVKKEGKVLDEKPFFRVSEIIVPSRGVMVSANAIFEAVARGIQQGEDEWVFTAPNGDVLPADPPRNVVGDTLTWLSDWSVERGIDLGPDANLPLWDGRLHPENGHHDYGFHL